MNAKLMAVIVVGAVVIAGGVVGVAIVVDSPDVPGSLDGDASATGTETELTPIPTETASTKGTQTPGGGIEATTEPSSALESEEQIQRALATRINEYRAQNGLGKLATNGRHGDRLEAIATAHSQAMARERTVDPSIAGNTTADRYKTADLYTACTFATSNDMGLVEPEFGRTELLANPIRVADYEQPSDGYTGNALAVANVTVSSWSAESETRTKLEYTNAEQMGIGVTRTDRNAIYVAVALCDA